jgi:hypothetical protein
MSEGTNRLGMSRSAVSEVERVVERVRGTAGEGASVDRGDVLARKDDDADADEDEYDPEACWADDEDADDDMTDKEGARVKVEVDAELLAVAARPNGRARAVACDLATFDEVLGLSSTSDIELFDVDVEAEAEVEDGAAGAGLLESGKGLL